MKKKAWADYILLLAVLFVSGLGVAISVILSLILFHGAIKGTREGTIIAAFLTGICVKCFSRIFKHK